MDLLTRPTRIHTDDGQCEMLLHGLQWRDSFGQAMALVMTALAAAAVWQADRRGAAIVIAIVAVAPWWLDCIGVFVPRLVLGALSVGGALALAELTRFPNSAVAWFLLQMGVGELGLLGSSEEGGITFAGALTILLVLMLRAPGNQWQGYVGWTLGSIACFVGCKMGQHQIRVTNELRAAQASLAVQAASDERRRIAREVHDVIAHSLTVTMLHLTGARLTLEHDPSATGEAIGALEEAERAGRQSLVEIRRTVGLLSNAEPDSSSTQPLPGVADLESLVASYADAGVDVVLEVDGDPQAASPAVGLALYRIVQESLTNAAKHASGAGVTVRVSFGPEIRLWIRNGMTGSAAPSEGGLGVPGMVERAELLGGNCTAGPGPDGWTVEATLPNVDATLTPA